MSRRDRILALGARAAPVALVAALGVVMLLPLRPALELTQADPARVSRMVATLDGLQEGALVVIGFDPDVGTYAEIRPTVRALLADLFDRGAALALVSFTPEGRALAVGEMERMPLALAGERLLDLGFRPGAEAALVRATQRPLDEAARGQFAPLGATGIGGADLALVIGGNDIGPRSWVEQVATRLPDVPLAAVTPTVMLPEIQPYLASGQLDALLGTIHDGAAYRASLEPALASAEDGERATQPLVLLIGMLVALVTLAQALVGRDRGRAGASQRSGGSHGAVAS